MRKVRKKQAKTFKKRLGAPDSARIESVVVNSLLVGL